MDRDTNKEAVSLYIRPRNDKKTQNKPDKIRCFIGGEWKPVAEFSGRQLEKFTRSRAHPANSEISCRAHSTQIRREIKCEGPCEKWLPIENFSRSTRSHSKTWCMNCTDWQLSVEPGYTPYLPPSSFDDDEDEDDDEYDDDDADTTCTIAPPDDTPVERIENWIHGNPSELGDYDSVETNTHTSIAESASGVSSRSLLDLQNSELEWLNEVLTSKNLDTAVSAGSANQSYASVASTIRAPETIGSEFSSSATGKQLKTREQTRAAGTSGLAQGSRSASQTLYSGDSMISQTKTLVGASTAWMESGFQALSIASPQPTQRFETRNGWARPNQRKTYSTAPRYVAHHGDVDHLAHNVLKPSYSYADDDGSEDEC